MTVTIFGIKNCDTMKKARNWLENHGVDYVFHDYKQQGIERQRLETWCDEVGFETLVNRAGTTFRNLPEADKQGLDKAKAIGLMLQQPSLIKRPVLDLGARSSSAGAVAGRGKPAHGTLLVGFKPEIYAAAFATR